MSATKRVQFSLATSLLPFFVTLGLLLFFTYRYGEEAGEGYNQLALAVGALVAIGIGLCRKVDPRVIWRGVLGNMKPVVPTLLFFFFFGTISVSWLLGGIIPTTIYYGLKYLSPATFLMTIALFSALMGLACGSSWLTIGTMGVAFLGVGKIMGFPPPWVAGAIISGAYFGDKLTPLSETTILAASMTKTKLLRHVRYMLLTSVPCFVVTLGCFGLLGLLHTAEGTVDDREVVMGLLEERFYISPLLLLIPLQVMVFTMVGFPPLVILSVGTLLGVFAGLIYQAPFLAEIMHSTSFSWLEGLWGVVRSLFVGVTVEDGHPVMERLLSSGGIWGMWPTLTIIVAAVLLGGAMEGTGLLHTLMDRIGKMCSYRMLVLLTTCVAIFFNITLADQYLAIILASKIFLPLFSVHGLASENLSRAVEDAATVTSPLVPWNTCGVMQAKVLNVATMDYLPYCFFNLLSPLFSIAYHAFGINIAKTTPSNATEQRSSVAGDQPR